MLILQTVLTIDHELLNELALLLSTVHKFTHKYEDQKDQRHSGLLETKKCGVHKYEHSYKLQET